MDRILEMDTSTTADVLFWGNILCTDEACFTREGVFSVDKGHLWVLGKHHAILERG
jgi:hypothetical protein